MLVSNLDVDKVDFSLESFSEESLSDRGVVSVVSWDVEKVLVSVVEL